MKLRTIILTDPIKAANKINSEKTLQFFEESVINHITDPTSLWKNWKNGVFYFLAYDKGDNLVGVASVSQRTEVRGIWASPFIIEFGTVNYTKTCKYAKKGLGESLLNQIIKKIGNEFRLFCLDNNAEQFWRHMGEKKNLKVTELGKTRWGTPTLYFRDFE